MNSVVVFPGNARAQTSPIAQDTKVFSPGGMIPWDHLGVASLVAAIFGATYFHRLAGEPESASWLIAWVVFLVLAARSYYVLRQTLPFTTALPMYGILGLSLFIPVFVYPSITTGLVLLTNLALRRHWGKET